MLFERFLGCRNIFQSAVLVCEELFPGINLTSMLSLLRLYISTIVLVVILTLH